MRRHSFLPAPRDFPTFGWNPKTMGELFVDVISTPSIRLYVCLPTSQTETRTQLTGIACLEDA